MVVPRVVAFEETGECDQFEIGRHVLLLPLLLGIPVSRHHSSHVTVLFVIYLLVWQY